MNGSVHERMAAAARQMEAMESGAVGFDPTSMIPVAVDVLGLIANRIPDPATKLVINAAVMLLRQFSAKSMGPESAE